MQAKLAAAFLLVALVSVPAWSQGNPSSAAQNVQITSGPPLEQVSDNSATVSWSTSANSSAIVRYGIERNKLDQTAKEPWGGTTHRVALQNLQPILHTTSG